jgi:predicted nucleotidyltransferase
MNDEVIENQVEKLSSKNDVRAVAVVGSYARDPEQDHNDLDLYIIVEGEWRKRETEKIDGEVVEKFYNSMQRSREYLEEDGWYTNYRWFTNADVRYDPDDLFEELEEYAEQKKEEQLELDKDDEEWIRYSLWDLRQDIESEDVGQQRYMLYQAVEFVVEQDFYLEDVVPVKDNYRVRKLKEFDGYLYKLVQDFLNSSSTLEKKRKVEKMFSHIERKVGEADPEYSSPREELD